MTDENNESIKISAKSIAAIVILLLLLVGTFGMFILKTSSNGSGFLAAQEDSSSGSTPEKCRLPTGQDLNSWKEHLGHHADTQDCLNYFK